MAGRTLLLAEASQQVVVADAMLMLTLVAGLRWRWLLLAPSWRWAPCMENAASLMAHARKVLGWLQHALLYPSMISGGLHLVSVLMSILLWRTSPVQEVIHAALTGML